MPPSFVKPPAPGEPVFIFGTDYLGRDVLSRVMYGARVSMIVGFVPVVIILIVGVSIGLCAGYRGGRTDNLLMRLTDIVYAFPALLFYIIVMTALRDSALGQLTSGMILLFISLALVSWVGCARLVRGQVLSLKRKEFVEAARMIGATDTEILIKHILPNALSPIIVTTAFLIPALIITEATLGYLGLGLRPGTDARDVLRDQLGIDAAGRAAGAQLSAVVARRAGALRGRGGAGLQLPGRRAARCARSAAGRH